MVILQFNKLIRNKWVWGAFAIAISAFFAFDFLLDDLRTPSEERERTRGAGKLAGEDIDGTMFVEIAEELRGIGRQGDWKTPQNEINERAWRNYAALVVAGKDGIEATDAEVRRLIREDGSFQTNGAFDFDLYNRILRDNSLTPERYEAMVKRRLTLSRVGANVLGSATWTSPMELDQAIADMTDVLTVKVARFSQSKSDADKVELDDDGLKKWYDDNVKDLALPERVRIRYVKFDATNADLLAKMSVTDDEMHDRYDATIDKYTSTDTNGVETVKSFEDVKGEIEKDLRRIAAVEFFETNLNYRAYAIKAAAGSSRLDEIAKEDGLKVETSDWFAVDNSSYQEGFMKYSFQILPGARDLSGVVAALDSESEDLRYGVVTSDRAVWLVEKLATNPAHTPDFAEAKEAIRNRALRAAKADAFKRSVEEIAAKGAAAVLATGDVSTNLVFSVSDLSSNQNTFPDQMAIARAASSLKKGEVSEFTLLGTGKALLAVCEDRVQGDAAKAMVLKSQVQRDVAMLAARQLPESWLKWNLERMGFETGDVSSIESVETEE